LSFKGFSLEEGLSNSNVTCLLQDKRGYLWVGTLGGGVNRFDGTVFTTLTKKDGLVGNEVRAMLEADDGRIWLGTNEGISVYDGIRFKTIDAKLGLRGTNILCLFEDEKGRIWAGTDDAGVNVIEELSKDSFSIKNFDQSSGLSNNFIFEIDEGPDGNLWFATFYGGIDIVAQSGDSISVQWLKGTIDIPSSLIICLEKDGNGGMWVGSYDRGVFHLSPTEAGGYQVDEIYGLASEVGDNTVWDLHIDADARLWIATNSKGLRRKEGSVFASFTEVNGLPNNQLLCLLEDREGNVWIGTNGNGLARFSGEHFIHLTESSGFFLDQVYCIRQFEDGRLLFSSYGSGIAVQRDPLSFEFDYLTANTGLPGNYVSSVTIDTNDHIWAATENGVVRYDGKFLDTYTEATGLLSNVVNVIHADRLGVIWCGTKYGVSAIAGDRVLNITTEEGLIDNTVTDIIEDQKGNIWFATLGGLAKYDRSQLQTFDEVEGLTYKRINTLAEDARGNIFIATNGGGLFWLNAHTSDSVNIQKMEHPDLSSQSYTDIAFMDAHTLIAGFNHGFDRIVIEDSEITSVTSYEKSDGYLGVETNFNAIFVDNTSRVWFGTPIGATLFRPSLEPQIHTEPQVHIDGVKLFYQDVNWSDYSDELMPWNGLPKQLELRHTDRQLTFQFTGISHVNPEKVLYRHVLEGAEEVWSPPQSDRQITYPGLTPGTYTFKVVAIDANGKQSEPAEFKFSIKPPWYQTTLFYILCFIALIILIYAFISYREMKLKEEKEYLERVVAERTAEVVQQKEIIEHKNKDITDSINYASRIQEAMLPNMGELNDHFDEAMIIFMPKDIVSGDFFWFSERNGKIFFTASDCTGHGVPGAFMSMIGASLLNDCINEKELDHPDLILNETRQGVIFALNQTGEEGQQKDGMDMALCSFEPSSMVLEFAGANNPMYVLRNSNDPLEQLDGTKIEAWEEINGIGLFEVKPSKMPVGYYSGDMVPFERHSFKAKKGDVVYSFSDGYPDQFGGPKGKKFKYAALKRKLIEIYHLPMEQQKKALNNTILAWMGTDHEQIDDICVVAVRL
ncbi:MAG: two-component regulator propeller domain-containing protein, partial [Cryomorphaceae bacterium]